MAEPTIEERLANLEQAVESLVEAVSRVLDGKPANARLLLSDARHLLGERL